MQAVDRSSRMPRVERIAVQVSSASLHPSVVARGTRMARQHRDTARVPAPSKRTQSALLEGLKGSVHTHGKPGTKKSVLFTARVFYPSIYICTGARGVAAGVGNISTFF